MPDGMDLPFSQKFSLERRLAVVTGGSHGIGFGIARAIVAAGGEVLLVARNEADLAKATSELAVPGRRVLAEPFDLTKVEQLGPWYDGLVAQHGRPDILINAAGITSRAPAHELALAEWQATLNLNLTAVFCLCQAFARHCMEAGEPGAIVNIASLMSAAARRTTSAYTASKGGVAQLTKALAVDWAEFGIRVNAVAPGYIATRLTEPLWRDEEFNRWIESRCPLKRWGTAEEIANPVVFLASNAGAFITGQILYVDGGWTAAL